MNTMKNKKKIISRNVIHLPVRRRYDVIKIRTESYCNADVVLGLGGRGQSRSVTPKKRNVWKTILHKYTGMIMIRMLPVLSNVIIRRAPYSCIYYSWIIILVHNSIFLYTFQDVHAQTILKIIISQYESRWNVNSMLIYKNKNIYLHDSIFFRVVEDLNFLFFFFNLFLFSTLPVF